MWPSRPLMLKDVRPSKNTIVSLLGSGLILKWKPMGRGMAIEVPPLSGEERPCEHAYTIKLTHVEGERPR